MATYTAYLDESGNTGSDLLGSGQPIVTFSAVGIEDAKRAALEEDLRDLKQAYRIEPTQEIKGSSLLGSWRQPMITELTELLCAHGVQLFLAIVEKRYVVCTYVVDDFLDPVYNDRCDNRWTHPIPEKIEIANLLYERLSEATIAGCARAWRNGEGLADALTAIRREIEGSDYKLPLGELFGGAEPRVDSLRDTIATVNSRNAELGVDAGVVNSPNFFTYTSLINKIEHYYRMESGRSVDLIFDDSRQYNRTFLATFERIRDARPAEMFHDHDIPFITGYRAAKSFSSVPSRDHMLLQSADVIATGLRAAVEVVASGEMFHNDATLGLLLYFTHSLHQEFAGLFTDFFLSDTLLGKIVRTIYDKERINKVPKPKRRFRPE